MKNPWATGLYVLLDPETGKPHEYEGMFALQSNGNTFCDGLSLEQASYIERAVNAHDALTKALARFVAVHEEEYVSAIADEMDRDGYDETMDAALAALKLARGEP